MVVGVMTVSRRRRRQERKKRPALRLWAESYGKTEGGDCEKNKAEKQGEKGEMTMSKRTRE